MPDYAHTNRARVEHIEKIPIICFFEAACITGLGCKPYSHPQSSRMYETKIRIEYVSQIKC